MTRFLLLPAAVALMAMQTGSTAMQPGQWEFVTTMTELDMPGSPPDMVEAARSGIGRPRTESRCVSPEEAADPAARLMQRRNATNCDYSRTIFADGRIDIAGRCTSADGDPMEVALTGDFTAIDMRGAISADVANGTMRMRGTMTARRTGDCAPGAS